MSSTIDKNQLSISAGELVNQYQEKYNLIPEYILLSDNAMLNEYLDYSMSFDQTAKKIKRLLNKDQLSTFNQIIDNNNKLDQYFFSTVVPNVQNIHTDQFKELQQETNKLKNDTVALGTQLKNSSNHSSVTALNSVSKAFDRIDLVLILSAIISLAISFIFLYFMSRNIRKNLKEIVIRSENITNGNLNIEELEYVGNDEIGMLSSSINQMGSSLRMMISGISELSDEVDKQSILLQGASVEVKQSSEQVALAIEEIAKGSTNQADSASTIAQNMNKFNEDILIANEDNKKLVLFSDEVLQGSINGNKLMEQSLNQMKLINRVVQTSVNKVRSLENKTESITEIVSVIKAIANQTNLLSLNASIEAARAGEAGKGFAVVATEVRKLADEVSQSVENISSIVFSIKEETAKIAEDLNQGYVEVNKGTDQIELTGKQFYEIKEKVADMSSKVKTISTVFTKVQKASEEINESVENIAAISEESAAGTQEISASVYEEKKFIENISTSSIKLTKMVEKMNEMIKQFKL